MFIAPEQATVYRANGRRYLSKRNAYLAIARAKVKAQVLEYWDKEDHPMSMPHNIRVVNRFARLMAHYDRVEMRGKR